MHALLRSLPSAAFKRTLPLSGSRCLAAASSSPSPNSCLILGATSSISFEVVRHLLARGVRVLATGRDESRLKELQDMGASTMQASSPRSGACPLHAPFFLLFSPFIFSLCRLACASACLRSCQPPPPQVDARKSDEVKNAVAEAVKQFGSLSAALNCAGSIVLKPAHSTSEAEFISTLETNLHSAFFLVKHAAPVIAKAGGGQPAPSFSRLN